MSRVPRESVREIRRRLESIISERDNLLIERDNFKSQIKSKDAELEGLKADLERLQPSLAEEINRRMELEERLRVVTAKEIKVEELSSHFVGVLKEIQKELDKEEKGLRYYVDKLEVEVRAGLRWEEGLKLVQPKIEELKPESLSTLKISFKSAPRLRIARESERGS